MESLLGLPEIIRVKIDCSRSLPPLNNHRRWEVNVRVSLPDGSERKNKRELRDPFVINDYERYERSIQGTTLSSRTGWSDRDMRSGSDNRPFMLPESSTESAFSRRSLRSSVIDADDATDLDDDIPQRSPFEEYRLQLRNNLALNDWWDPKYIIKISISEDFTPGNQHEDHYCSIHSLLWELLEHEDPNFETSQERNRPIVQITRWITRTPKAQDLPASLCGNDGPISLLLILARSLRRHIETDELPDAPSVVHDTLYAMREYLRLNGCPERLSIEVVRPGSFQELESHLKRGKRYNLVHIDVHGILEQ